MTKSLQDEQEDLLLIEYDAQSKREEVAPILEPFKQHHRIKIVRGGRGGGAKSYGIASLLIQAANYERKHIACLREVQLTLEESVHKLLGATIQRLGYKDWKITKESIDNTRTCSHIIFRGISDLRADQLKSLEGFDIFWLEEAQDISDGSLDVLLPTLRKEGSELWASMNPNLEVDPIISRFINRKDALIVTARPGKLDNPWWTKELQAEMEADFARDPELAEHIWNGAPMIQGARSIFSRVKIRQAMDRVLDVPDDAPVEIGVDVARFGDDLSVIYKRRGMKVIDSKKLSHRDTQEVARVVWDMAERDRNVKIKVDDDGVGCITGNTKVFTPNGWILATALNIGDSIYSKNSNGELVIESIRGLTKHDDTRVIECDGFEFSFSHVLPYKTRVKYPFLQNSWENALQRKHIILDDEVKYSAKDTDFVLSGHNITMPYGGTKIVRKELSVSGGDFCKLLGWFASEGSLDHKRKKVIISQKKPLYRPEIKEIIAMFGAVKETDAEFSINNVPLYNWLKENAYQDGCGFYNKIVPRFVANNSISNIQIFLDSFSHGDGFTKNGVRYFITSSRFLVDDLQELIIKTGKRCGIYRKSLAGSCSMIEGRQLTRTVDNYCIFEYQQKQKEYRPGLITKDYKEKYEAVYELSITGESKLFMAKCSNNKPIWTHNGGVSDKLRDMGAFVIGVHNGAAAHDKVRYTSCADEQWFNFPIDDAQIPDDQALMEELSARQYSYTKQDQKKIEPKADFKKRFGHSPDSADALLLCFFHADEINIPDYSASELGL